MRHSLTPRTAAIFALKFPVALIVLGTRRYVLVGGRLPPYVLAEYVWWVALFTVVGGLTEDGWKTTRGVSWRDLCAGAIATALFLGVQSLLWPSRSAVAESDRRRGASPRCGWRNRHLTVGVMVAPARPV